METTSCMDDDYSRPPLGRIEECVGLGVGLCIGTVLGFGLAVAVGAITGVIG